MQGTTDKATGEGGLFLNDLRAKVSPMADRINFSFDGELLHQWDLDVFPPTSNHMQRTGRATHIRFDTAEYKQFKRDCAALLVGSPDLSAYRDEPLILVVSLHWSGWWTKGGKIRTGRDASNRYKAIEDAIFRAIGIDDSRNVAPFMPKARPQNGRDRYIVARLFWAKDYEEGENQ